jgi:hypothetical protein
MDLRQRQPSNEELKDSSALPSIIRMLKVKEDEIRYI